MVADATVAADREGLSWGRESWFPQWEAEHRACREGVILMDMSFMSKFLVQGRDAGGERSNRLGLCCCFVGSRMEGSQLLLLAGIP